MTIFYKWSAESICIELCICKAHPSRHSIRNPTTDEDSYHPSCRMAREVTSRSYAFDQKRHWSTPASNRWDSGKSAVHGILVGLDSQITSYTASSTNWHIPAGHK